MSDESQPMPADPVLDPGPPPAPAPPSLEDRAKACEAFAAAFHDSRAKSAASAAAADADKAATQKAHGDLTTAIADLVAAAQAEDA